MFFRVAVRMMIVCGLTSATVACGVDDSAVHLPDNNLAFTERLEIDASALEDHGTPSMLMSAGPSSDGSCPSGTSEGDPDGNPSEGDPSEGDPDGNPSDPDPEDDSAAEGEREKEGSESEGDPDGNPSDGPPILNRSAQQALQARSVRDLQDHQK